MPEHIYPHIREIDHNKRHKITELVKEKLEYAVCEIHHQKLKFNVWQDLVVDYVHPCCPAFEKEIKKVVDEVISENKG
jgi:hypothetical protein